MKKPALILFALSLLSTVGYAQAFYFRAGLGYAFPQAGQTLDGTGTPYSGTQTYLSQTQAYNIKGASFSAGFQGVIGLGYMINEHIGIQLDAGIGLTNKKYTFDISNVNIGGVESNVSIVQQAKTPFIVIPQLVLQSGGAKVNLYCRFGLAMPLNTKITEDEIISNVPGTGAILVDDYTFQIKNSFSLGFTGAAGIQYKLNDRVSIWGELSLLSMSVYIKEADLKTVTENGQNVPLNYVGGPQVIQYSKNVTVDSNGANQPAYSQPFSNIGINIGVTFSLSQKQSRHSGKFNNEDIDTKKPFRRR